MNVIRLADVIPPTSQRRPMRRYLYAGLCCLLLLCVVSLAQAAEREAKIAVMANMLDNSSDQVNLRIVGSTDPQVLTQIVRTLGEKFRTQPTDITQATSDPGFVEDGSIGLDFRLPIVPRGNGTLPLAPFIEAMAPHVTRLRLVYIIQGPFTYRGYQQYENDDVVLEVDKPETSPPNSPVPLAFYGVNVIIKNQTLKTVPLPDYRPGQEPHTPFRLHPLLWVLIAGIVGAGVGLVLSKVLLRKRS